MNNTDNKKAVTNPSFLRGILFLGLVWFGAVVVARAAEVDSYAGIDWRIKGSSILIDKGNSAFVKSLMDHDGNVRIVGASVDLGAFEFQQSAKLRGAESSLELTFYPNPVTDFIYLDQLSTVSIYSSEGSLLIEKKGVAAVDVSGLTTGSYFIKIFRGGLSRSFQFIKH